MVEVKYFNNETLNGFFWDFFEKEIRNLGE